MRYLITGGLGYVGSWLSRHLALQGHTVFVLSRKDTALSIGAPYTLIQADLVQNAPEELAKLLPEGLDGCVHAASCNESFLPHYGREALLCNALGTRNLLDALVHQSTITANMAPLPFVIYCSTIHVTGKSSGQLDAQTAASPKTDYALTHFFGEEYCKFFTQTTGIPTLIARLTNSYGHPITTDFSKWYLIVNDLCKQAVTQRHIRLSSNPAIERDFIWLGDVANCFAHLLQRRDLSCKTFICGSGQSFRIGHIAETVARIASTLLGQPIPLEYMQPEQPVSALNIDASPLWHELGLSPGNHLEEEIRATLQQAMKHYG